MAHVIAVAGKGGVGKTTLCGMLIQYLCEKGKGPILAVDADANSNLNEVLGVKVETTLGDVREEIARAELAKENPIPTGMSKADYAEMRFEDALVEDDDFDLLVMGRTQGKGCSFTVKYGAFRAQRFGGKGCFLQLAAAQHDAGLWGLALLGHLCHSFHVVCFAQGGKLCKAALAVPQALIQRQQNDLRRGCFYQNIVKFAQGKSFLLYRSLVSR